VLAAGFSSRLAEAGDYSLKPLTPIAGTPLIFRTLRSLELAGCERIVIVLGHGAKEIQESIEHAHAGPMKLKFATNDQYHLSNGLSVLAAAPFIGDEFVLTMADHVLGDELMAIARSYSPAPGSAALLVDYKLSTIFDMDDATKVLAAQDGRIERIGKTIPKYNCVDTGVFVCTPGLLEGIEKVFAEKGDASLSDGVQALCDRQKMFAIDVGDGFWQDVDTRAMLAHAECMLRERQLLQTKRAGQE
jgi:1L-myo-inositol 1-phosphate cytidylyltransferase